MNPHIGNLDTQGEKIAFDHGQLNAVTLDGTMIARAVLNPGWRWSTDVKPGSGTESCQARHAGVVLSGRLHVRMDNGTEADLGPGDAHVVPPGHDAWVVGDEQCLIIDIGPGE
jgi:mannose-6-phosphate isomerase-like protein (cupin superfamily)